MRHAFLDRYSRLESPVHRIPPVIKLIGTLALIVVTVSVSLRHQWVFGAIAVVLLWSTSVSRIPWRFVLGRLLLLEPFALGIAVMALFQHNGLAVFLTLFVKSTLCLYTMILVSNTTPFSEILAALRTMRIPSLLITVLALAYRYLFVLIDEGERLQRARRSRTFDRSRTKSWIALSSLIGQLFVRSSERAERIYAAMTSRGWK
jgi:cobalt/nickel transport system permease protein